MTARQNLGSARCAVDAQMRHGEALMNSGLRCMPSIGHQLDGAPVLRRIVMES
jgi:hypothetical protein